jgi:hypothetical protein
LPDQAYHIEKRDKFRNTAAMLENSAQPFTYDPTVQDYFYSMMHDAERFLAVIGIHSSSHRNREQRITNFMIEQRRRIVDRATYSRHPIQPSDRLFDRASESLYMELLGLRLDVVYGNHLLGPLRHASSRDVQRARILYQRFINSIARHERSLQRRRII